MSGLADATRPAAASPRQTHGRMRIGISGRRYADWRGGFHPPGLLQADELAYASRHFETIGINGKHHSLQRPRVHRALA